MSLFKLSLRNMQKSFSDYAVYFLTLIFGVGLFYVFNAIGDQSIIVSLSQSGYEIIQLMLLLLEGLSIMVAFVLGFLIIYANNFLIRRRKREFGIYLLLGMEKKDVSKILIGETMIVGVFSLAVGIGLGILTSQFMSILVGKFFDADMSAYAFSISMGAIAKTVINFAIMYIVVLVFHSVLISQYRLIDLFSAAKKAERQVLKNPVVATIIFVIAAVALGIAYYRVGVCAESIYRTELVAWILVGIIATFLVFWSLSGFLLSFLQGVKGFYHKGLNAFVIRQFCSSMNTSSVSMAIICLMLFAMICTFSAGFSVAHELQENIREKTPVDYSIVYKSEESVSDWFEEQGMDTGEWAGENMLELPLYQSASVTYRTSLGAIFDKASEQFPYARWETPEDIMRLSDYNRLSALYGNEIYRLAEDEYMVVCDFFLFAQLRNMTLAAGGTQSIGSVELKPAFAECVEGYLLMSGGNTNMGIIVVPDAVVDNHVSELTLAGHVMAGDYLVVGKDGKREVDQRLLQVTAEATAMNYAAENPLPAMTVGTKIMVRESNNGLTMAAAFIVIYVGVVFLIASAALLALKALSESIDATGKFAILKKIGSERKLLNKALFVQIGAYFALPLLVAVIHSFFGLMFIDYAMSTFTQQGLLWGVCVTAAIIMVLYGGYLLATFRTSQRIVELND